MFYSVELNVNSVKHLGKKGFELYQIKVQPSTKHPAPSTQHPAPHFLLLTTYYFPSFPT
jgi:hypothetical protein